MKKPRNTFVYVHVNYSKNIIFKVIFVICKVLLLYNPYNCCSDTLGFNDLFECARKKKTKQNVKLLLKKEKKWWYIPIFIMKLLFVLHFNKRWLNTYLYDISSDRQLISLDLISSVQLLIFLRNSHWIPSYHFKQLFLNQIQEYVFQKSIGVSLHNKVSWKSYNLSGLESMTVFNTYEISYTNLIFVFLVYACYPYWQLH